MSYWAPKMVEERLPEAEPRKGGMFDGSVETPHASVLASSNRVVLAVDLGTTTGWAIVLPDSGIASGTVSFKPSRYDGGGMRYLRFRAWLNTLGEDVLCLGDAVNANRVVAARTATTRRREDRRSLGH